MWYEERAARGPERNKRRYTGFNLNSTKPPLMWSPRHISEVRNRDISLKTPRMISVVRTRDACMTGEAVRRFKAIAPCPRLLCIKVSYLHLLCIVAFATLQYQGQTPSEYLIWITIRVLRAVSLTIKKTLIRLKLVSAGPIPIPL